MSTSLREIFDTLVDLPLDERDAALARLRLSDEETRQLLSWLAADATSGSLIPESAERLLRRIESQQELVDRWVGQTVGSFELAERIGEGGTSVVFRAQRPVGTSMQVVALKLLYAGLSSPGQKKRTTREQSILAQLHHPNIAHLVEAGSTVEGIPYIATEFVVGKPITTWAREHRLDLQQRLGLVVQLCAPIEAAHAMLTVHCDLKPSNVFVDSQGAVKVLDFGVARLLSPEDGADETRTCAFTPEYAAPEQFRPGPTTTAVDIYAIGVLLNELITGQRTGPSLPPPSQQVASSPARVPEGLGPAGALSRSLRGDIDAIVAKATAVDARHRYHSALALAADIKRHLDGRPVEARAWSRRYTVSKFLVRNRWLVAASAAFALALGATAIVAIQQAALARTHAQIAEKNAADAQAQARRAEGMRDAVFDVFSQANPAMPRDHQVTVLEAVEHGVDSLLADASAEPRSRLELLAQFANTLGRHGQIDRALALLRQTYSESVDVLGASDEVTLSIGERLGYYLERSGRYAESLELAEQLLDAGPDASIPVRNRLLRRVASAAWRSEDAARAASASAAAMALAKQSADPEMQRSTLSDHAIVLLESGELAQAVEALEAVLALNEAEFGPEHEKVALASAALSRAYRRLHRYELAVSHANRAIAISRAIYEGDHWTTGNHMNALSRAQSAQREFEAALATDLEILRIYRATLPADHPDVRAGYAVVGMSLGKLGRFADALPYFEQALSIQGEPTRRSRVATAHYRCHHGHALGMAADIDRGLDAIRKARAAFASLEVPAVQELAACLEHEIRLSLRGGYEARAAASLEVLEQTLGAAPNADTAYWTPRIAVFRSRIALASGQPDGALEALDAAGLLADTAAPFDPEMRAEALLVAASARQAAGEAVEASRFLVAAQSQVADIRFPSDDLKRFEQRVAMQLRVARTMLPRPDDATVGATPAARDDP
jgi:tetratricopeptide (TPR) repeat protein